MLSEHVGTKGCLDKWNVGITGHCTNFYYRILMRGCGQEIIQICMCYYWIFGVQMTDLFGWLTLYCICVRMDTIIWNKYDYIFSCLFSFFPQAVLCEVWKRVLLLGGNGGAHLSWRGAHLDYGNTHKLATTSVRCAKPMYLTLPAQAVQCRLSHLKPAVSVSESEVGGASDELVIKFIYV